MSDTVDFSGAFYVNTDASTTTRFSSFSIGSATDDMLTYIQNRLGGTRPIAMTFQGTGLLDELASLEAIACEGVMNGAPRYNQAGFSEAVARSGELVKITAKLADNTSRSSEGIIANLTTTIQGGKYGQRIEFVFYPCNRLRFITSATYLSTASDA